MSDSWVLALWSRYFANCAIAHGNKTPMNMISLQGKNLKWPVVTDWWFESSQADVKDPS